MSGEKFDLIVIGAGIIGNCAAYHGVKRGLKVLKIDQFDIHHNKGSSHGHTRIIRYAHSDKRWIPVVKDTYLQIEELEKTTGVKLYNRNGLLWMGSPTYIKKLYSGCSDPKDDRCKLSILTAQQIKERFPFFQYDDRWQGIFDATGGTIYADEWMKVFHDEFLAAGGQFLPNTEVSSYSEGNGVITVTLGNGEVVQSKKLVIAAGSWVNKLVPQLAIQSKNTSVWVNYWQPEREESVTDSTPVVIVDDQFNNGRGYFGIPDKKDGWTVYKFSEHGGDSFEAGAEPEERHQRFLEQPQAHLKEYYPEIDSKCPSHVDYCKYTMSPDGRYIVDYLPNTKNIVLCAMMCGTGFKVAPALGKCLVHMALGEELPFDISFYGADRFENTFHKN